MKIIKAEVRDLNKVLGSMMDPGTQFDIVLRMADETEWFTDQTFRTKHEAELEMARLLGLHPEELDELTKAEWGLSLRTVGLKVGGPKVRGPKK